MIPLRRGLRLLPWLVAVVLLAIRAPLWMDLFSIEGRPLPRIPVAEKGTLQDALNEQSSKILIFWASWCGPCDTELERFADAVKGGELPRDRVLAVSIDEDPAAYTREIAEKSYPFRTYLDRSGLARTLKVQVTPTVLHLRADQTVDYATAGVSPLSIWRAKRFLGE